jgi:hypothetical protein
MSGMVPFSLPICLTHQVNLDSQGPVYFKTLFCMSHNINVVMN